MFVDMFIADAKVDYVHFYFWKRKNANELFIIFLSFFNYNQIIYQYHDKVQQKIGLFPLSL